LQWAWELQKIFPLPVLKKRAGEKAVTGLGSPNFAKMLDYVKAGRPMKRLPTRY
jgi:hypothetical protein